VYLADSGEFGTGEVVSDWIWVDSAFFLVLFLSFAWMTKADLGGDRAATRTLLTSNQRADDRARQREL
jgi:hypothetical protein